MAGVVGWEGEPGKDRRSGGDRRRSRPKRTGFFIYKSDGRVVEVVCRALAMVNFEEKFKVNIGKAVGDLPASRISWLAFECERLYGGYTNTYERWLEELDTIEEWEEDLPFYCKSVGFGVARVSAVTGIPPQFLLDPALSDLMLTYIIINAADVYGER